MSTSDLTSGLTAGTRLHTVVVEAAIATALVTGCVALGSPRDPWLAGLGLHPSWIAVLVLAARYGIAGLFTSLALAIAALVSAGIALGIPLDGLAARATRTSDLFSLTAAVAVAWVAASHQGRAARLAARLGDAERSRDAADDARRAVESGVIHLRARADRIDVSLALWRDIAHRLDSGTAMQAATAALELTALRTGAASGTVHLWDGTALHVLTRHGREAADSQKRGFWRDRTARAAVDRCQVAIVTQVDGATEADSDVAVPILDGNAVLGVIALTGLAPARLRGAELHELGVVAQWLAPALQRPRAHAPAPRYRSAQPERP